MTTSTAATKKKRVSPSKEDYLKAIWTLSERRADNQGVGTNNLAEQMQVSPPAVSKMLKQMEQQLLVTRLPYYGVKLTDKGRTFAIRIVRRHRLLELFLSQVLKYPSDTVHDEAEHLEHHISDEFEARIDALLGYPKACPHGSPIPSIEGDF